MSNPYKYHPPRKTLYERLNAKGIGVDSINESAFNHYNLGPLYFDDQVGIIFNKLKELNLMENTLIIITADHSIEPGKTTTYEAGVKVPFIAYWNGKIANGSHINCNVSFVDFLPTFADLAQGEFSKIKYLTDKLYSMV